MFLIRLLRLFKAFEYYLLRQNLTSVVENRTTLNTTSFHCKIVRKGHRLPINNGVVLATQNSERVFLFNSKHNRDPTLFESLTGPFRVIKKKKNVVKRKTGSIVREGMFLW